MSNDQQREEEVYILEEFEGHENGWVEANSPFQFDDYKNIRHEAYHRSKHNTGVYRIIELDEEDATICLIYYGGRRFIPALSKHDGSNNQL